MLEKKITFILDFSKTVQIIGNHGINQLIKII